MPLPEPCLRTSCGIGRMYLPSANNTFPVFVADHGRGIPSLFPIASSYQKLMLSIDKRENGKWCFWIASDERTPGTDQPELSIMYDASEEARDRFVATQENSKGVWLLFLVSQDVTELTISSDGTVVSRERRPLSYLSL